MSYLGKILLFIALTGYSYLLVTDVSLGNKFETKYAEF